MNLLHAMRNGAEFAFWAFVVWAGGPTHSSYSHSVWRRWQAREGLRRFIESGE